MFLGCVWSASSLEILSLKWNWLLYTLVASWTQKSLCTSRSLQHSTFSHLLEEKCFVKSFTLNGWFFFFSNSLMILRYLSLVKAPLYNMAKAWRTNTVQLYHDIPLSFVFRYPHKRNPLHFFLYTAFAVYISEIP